jgi:UDP:flavonoid glycosyltransferase YjiC (YdhE family)
VRVLVSCCTGYGHLHPMLALAKAIEDRGHEVAVAVGPSLARRAEAAGFRALPAGISLDEGESRLGGLFPDRRHERLLAEHIFGWYVPHLFGDVLAPAMLGDLDGVVADWKPHLIVHDTFEFAGPIAAAAAGIPSACLSLGLRISDKTLDDAAQAVAALWRARGLAPDPSAGVYRHLCLEIAPAGLQPDLTGRGRAVRHQLRPLALPPLPGEKLPAWIEADRHRPLVYLTLGTNTNRDLSMFRAAVDGLVGVDLDLFLTIGFENDAELLGPLPDRTHVEAYVPQSLLLPRCTAMICHGGSGTTLNGLAEGLPLLLLPQGSDQFEMADLVSATGAGLTLTPAEVNPASVREAVLALLGDRRFRSRAQGLKAEIAAMPGSDAAVGLIEGLVG